MKHIVLWTLLGASLSANAAVAAVALGRGRGGGGMAGEPPLFAKASLDPGQRARIMELRERLLADWQEQAGRLAALRGELADHLARETVDAVAVDATLAAIEGAQSGFQRRVVAHVLAVREVLRPEQRPAFQALVAEHMRGGAPLDPSAMPGAMPGAPSGARP